MRLGALVTPVTPWPPTSANPEKLQHTLLYQVALQWLAEDRTHRRSLEQSGRKKRGARMDQVYLFRSIHDVLTLKIVQGVPSDSETFYKKYDHLSLRTS